jgi:HD-like signal output (HDOD) protein
MNLPETPTAVQLVEGFGPLPPAAFMLARLQRLLADRNSGLEDISDLLRLDAALATRVIQVSNSAWFGGGMHCKTVLDSVSRIGFREVYHLVAVVASNSVVARPLAAYGHDAAATWRESVACAFAAEILADRLGEDAGAAYTSGLLHAIGRLPINHYLTVLNPLKMTLANHGFPQDFSGSEFALLGFNQAEVSAVMLKKWDFAESTVESIRWQYDPLKAPSPHVRFAAILYAARLLRTAACESTPLPVTQEEEAILQTLRLSREDVLAYLPDLQPTLSRALQMTRL